MRSIATPAAVIRTQSQTSAPVVTVSRPPPASSHPAAARTNYEIELKRIDQQIEIAKRKKELAKLQLQRVSEQQEQQLELEKMKKEVAQLQLQRVTLAVSARTSTPMSNSEENTQMTLTQTLQKTDTK